MLDWLLVWTRRSGMLIALVLSMGRALLWLGYGMAAVLVLLAVVQLLTGAVPSGIVWLAIAGVVIACLQAGDRGDWRLIVPTIAVIAMAAATGYGVFLYASGQPVVMASRPEPLPTPLDETDPLTVEGDPQEDDPDEASAPEPASGSLADADDTADESGPVSLSDIFAQANEDDDETPEPEENLSEAAGEATDPIEGEEAQSMAAVTGQSMPFSEEDVAQAWQQVEEGRKDYGPSPERVAIVTLMRAGESFVGRDLSFLTLSKLRLRGAPPGDDPSERTSLDLTGVQFHGARLECTDLEDAQLTNAIFEFPEGLKNALSAEAQYTDARFANFRKATLDDARLGGSDLRFSNFERAKFGEADVAGAVFDYANLAGADLSRVRNLAREQLRHACMNRRTLLPDDVADAKNDAWSEQCEDYWGPSDRPETLPDYPFARFSRASSGTQNRQFFCD